MVMKSALFLIATTVVSSIAYADSYVEGGGFHSHAVALKWIVSPSNPSTPVLHHKTNPKVNSNNNPSSQENVNPYGQNIPMPYGNGNNYKSGNQGQGRKFFPGITPYGYEGQ